MRELVLQTLRVVNSLDRTASSAHSVVGEGLLMAYGDGRLDAPALAAYEALVQRAIDAVPMHVQQGIYYRWSMSQVGR
jgi:hypothetical protein